MVAEVVVVGGSQYRVNHQLNVNPYVPLNVINYATEIAHQWLPNRVCVLDICEVDGELSVLEIGDFHSAGFYASDIKEITQSVSDYVRYMVDASSDA